MTHGLRVCAAFTAIGVALGSFSQPAGTQERFEIPPEVLRQLLERFPVFEFEPPRLLLPDLVVSEFVTTGEPQEASVRGQTLIAVPVRATVLNQGSAVAGRFKVATEFKGHPLAPGNWFAVAFQVPGSSSLWYPFTESDLAPNGTATMDGRLLFNRNNAGNTTTVRIEADSCSGDEFTPEHCRVFESSETNNLSTEITVTLPDSP